MKKTLQLLFVTLLTVSFSHAQSAVGDTFLSEGIAYRITAMQANGDTTDEVVVSAENNNAATSPSVVANVVIPDVVNTPDGAFTVMSLDEHAFSENTSIKTLTFPANSVITSIPRQAFYACPALTTVTLSSSITAIGRAAFQSGPELISMNMENITSLDWNSLNGCPKLESEDFNLDSLINMGRGSVGGNSGLVELSLPAVVTLDRACFAGSAIETLSFGSDFATIYQTNALDGMANLTKIEVKTETAPEGIVDFSGTTKANITLFVPSEAAKTSFGSAWGTDFAAIVVGTLSVDKGENTLDFSFYPNPTTDMVYIKSKQLDNAEVAVYDLNGRSLLKKTISGTSSDINISNLSEGIYLFKVQVGGNEIVKRIVKQ